jgi:LysM repeat protein
MPQGSLQPSKGKSTVRIAVFTIVAIHAVFFAGLLMQGCKRDGDAKGKIAEQTNVSNELPKMTDATNVSPYYTNAAELPPVTTNSAAGRNPSGTDLAQTQPLSQSNTQQVTYQPPALVSTPNPAPAEAPNGESKEYTVARGDSLYKIAKAHHVTIGDITKLNPDLDPKALKPGQKIQVPAGGTSATPATGHAAGAGEAAATSCCYSERLWGWFFRLRHQSWRHPGESCPAARCFAEGLARRQSLEDRSPPGGAEVEDSSRC